jgi:hypothetical protein
MPNLALGRPATAPKTVSGVTMLWEAAYGKSYAIQLSDNGCTWRDVYSTTTGAGGAESVDFTPSTARYVRLRGLVRGTQYGYSLWEFQVH